MLKIFQTRKTQVPTNQKGAAKRKEGLSSRQVLKGRPPMPLDCVLFTPRDAKVAFS